MRIPIHPTAGGASAASAAAAVCLVASCATPHPVTPPTSFASPGSTRLQPRPAFTNVGFASPENLVYDQRDDVYLISNINGGPTARDANGFVSRVGPDGRMIALKWIDGSKPATRLDAPKGLAIHGDTLAIADVGCVRLFNVRTGASLGVWNVPGVLMNDVSFAPDGTLYVTDTGPNPGSKDTTGDHDAIFHFTAPDHPVALATGSDLGGPDGLIASGTGVVYATFHADRVVRVGRSGTRTTLATLPGGRVDGLRELPHGSFVVTSWDAHSVYHLMPDGHLTPIATGITSPAGVAYNVKRDRIAITSMQDNSMYIVSLR